MIIEKLTIHQIIQKIQNEETLEAISADYSFTIKIDDYVPYACGAVHDGHQFRKELWGNCIHTAYERWDREVPTWNLGTTNVDNIRFGKQIESWRATLEKMPLPNGIQSTSKINDTFQENGYFLKCITQNFGNTFL